MASELSTWTRPRWKTAALCAALCAAMLPVGHEAWAHTVKVFAYVQGEKIVAEGYFNSKTKAVDCGVQVIDSDGKTLMEGRTDSTGLFEFKAADLGPLRGDLRIVLHAGMGHQAEYNLAAADLPAFTKTASKTVAESKDNDNQRAAVPDPAPRVESDGALATDPVLFRKVVEEAVEAKIAPVLKVLENQQKLLIEQTNRGPSVTEIVGGIGWIFGIVGVAAYYMGRKRTGPIHIDSQK